MGWKEEDSVYLQFDQRVKRGEGVLVDPLDHIPAQITDKKKNKSEMDWKCLSLHTECCILTTTRCH